MLLWAPYAKNAPPSNKSVWGLWACISAFQSKSLTVIDPLEGEQLLTSELNELLNISLTFWRAGQEVLNNWSDPEFKKVCPGQSQEVFFWGLKDGVVYLHKGLWRAAWPPRLHLSQARPSSPGWTDPTAGSFLLTHRGHKVSKKRTYNSTCQQKTKFHSEDVCDVSSLVQQVTQVVWSGLKNDTVECSAVSVEAFKSSSTFLSPSVKLLLSVITRVIVPYFHFKRFSLVRRFVSSPWNCCRRIRLFKSLNLKVLGGF